MGLMFRLIVAAICVQVAGGMIGGVLPFCSRESEACFSVLFACGPVYP